ncbi:MAG: lactate utilization protein C [Gammaproteobacteria bacterium]|nr:MAG: lactate utilization protein C [Gammaproteobacteria bacterium]
MSAAREQILARVRRGLKRDEPLTADVVTQLEARTTAHESAVRPALGADLVARFTEKLSAVSGRVIPVPAMVDATDGLLAYLDEFDLPRSAVVSQGGLVDEMVWPEGMAVEWRVAGGSDRLSVTGAFCAVAETGTVVLLSAPESPTSLNFLPDDHIVLLGRSQLLPHLEDVWHKLREEVGDMPRTVNLVTGPSKTADVEQTIQLGAHGPRRFAVILVEQA